jgi:hypothetical protein
LILLGDKNLGYLIFIPGESKKSSSGQRLEHGLLVLRVELTHAHIAFLVQELVGIRVNQSLEDFDVHQT